MTPHTLIDCDKRCFTYCGDDHCNCPARAAHSVLSFVAPALPVLGTMLRTIGNKTGAAKADEMDAAIRALSPSPEAKGRVPTTSPDTGDAA